MRPRTLFAFQGTPCFTECSINVFSRDLRASEETENPCFLVVFLAFSREKQGQEDQFGCGPRMERFQRLQFSFPTVPMGKGFSVRFSTF